MAKIGRLSNQTRAAQRPPLLSPPVSSLLIARLLPVARSSKRRPEARSEKQSRTALAQSSAVQQSGQSTAQNGRAHPPVTPPSQRVTPAQTVKFPPKPQSSPKPDSPAKNGLTNNSPLKNGAASSPPVKNGSGRMESGRMESGRNSSGASALDIFSDISPQPERKPAEQKSRAVQPPAQIPLEPSQPAVEEIGPSAPPAANEAKPALEASAKLTEHQPQQRKFNTQRKAPLAPTLEKIFQEQPDLPAQAAVLGVDEEGVPVLLDLYDPAPGALVIIGDEREEQLNMLRSAVISLAARSSPRAVQFLILSCDPQQWSKWISEQGYERYCVSIEGVDDLDSARDWILRLGDWIEQRRTGQRSGPPILLVLDTLSFLPRLSYDIRLNFEWMAKEGPAAQIWPLAAISSDLAQMLSGRHLLRAFHTQILGFVDRPDFYVRQASLTPQAAEVFAEPGVFAVQVGEHWLRLRVPGR